MTAALRPVPVTAFSVCNALGHTRDQVRDALRDGRSGLAPTTLDVPFETFTGAVDLALPELPGDLAGWTTRTGQIVMHLLGELEPQLRRARERWRPERIAVVMGTSTAGADCTEAAYRQFVTEGALPEGYDLWRHHTYGAVLHVVRGLTGAAGPAWMHSTACTSSAKPLASARRLIASDMADAVIVGGVDTLCAMTLRGFHALGALDSNICKPFSSERRGINIGEGGALLLLEREGDPMALVAGVGESSDAYHISAPHPKGEGAEAAMRSALAQGGITPGDVDHINAHGTGTTLNDAAESQAIARLFGAEVPVVSTKGYTGHTLGGAGATEAAIAMYALLEGWIPASLGADPVDEKVEAAINVAPRTGRFDHVLSNSFAFGGNNVSVLLRSP